MNLYEDYLLVVLVAAAATYLLTFPVRAVALRLGAVDYPDDRRMHETPTATIGGAAMFLAFTLALFTASRLGALGQIFHGSSEPLGVVLAGLVIYLVGLIDDVRDISAPAKVAGQVLAAMVLVVLGVTMYYFKLPFVAGIITLSPSTLPLVTALWVVGMANAVNLIDGLDGLAAGIVAIAGASLCIYGLRLVNLGDLGPDNLGPLVAAIACGVCVGFLPHNFHPARVFMGDGGAMFLGLVMAAATMVTGGRTENVTGGIDVSGLTFFRFAPLFIPFFILGVPILDTAFAIVRRMFRRSNVAERDLGHLHHRLVRLGHGYRRAVLILWAWTAVLSGLVLLPTFDNRANAFVPVGTAVLVVGLYTLFRPGRAPGERRPARPRRSARLPAPLAVGANPGAPPPLEVPAASPTTARRPPGEPSTGPIPVVISGAAGVAVAGEPDLTSPKRSRLRSTQRALTLRHRGRHLRRADRPGGS